MQAGTFFATVPRQNPFARLLSLGSSSGRKSSFEGPLVREPAGAGRKSLFGNGTLNTGEQAGALPAKPIWWAWPGGAYIQVLQGEQELFGQVRKVQPCVHTTKDATCVFFGQLSNTEELVDRLRKGAFDDLGSSSSSLGDAMEDYTGHTIWHESEVVQGQAAEVVLGMFLRSSPANLPILLSELQGQYAFVIYDSRRKQVFAARDPTGSLPLFVAFGDEGSVSFANNPAAVPPTHDAYNEEWRELAPGHYIAGKHPTAKAIQQFALTPQELYEREEFYQESMTDYDLPVSPHAGGGKLCGSMYNKHCAPGEGIFAVSL